MYVKIARPKDGTRVTVYESTYSRQLMRRIGGNLNYFKIRRVRDVPGMGQKKKKYGMKTPLDGRFGRWKPVGLFGRSIRDVYAHGVRRFGRHKTSTTFDSPESVGTPQTRG